MKSILQNLKLVTLAIILSFGLSFAYAWVAPTQAPPNGNADEPITTRGGQVIRGNLTIGEPASPGTLNITRLAVLDGTGTPVNPGTGQVLSFRTPTQANPANVEWINVGGGGGGGGGGGIPPLPVISINALPTSVGYGGASTLTWSVTNATTCTASGGWTGGKSPTSGSETRTSLTVTAIYQLSCDGPGGTATNSVTINVGAVPTVTFTASPNPANASGNTTLSWSTVGANACTGRGSSIWNGSKLVPTGSQSIGGITSDRNFWLDCTAVPGGLITSRRVTVLKPLPPTVTLNVSTNTLPTGDLCENVGSNPPTASQCLYTDSVILSWSSTNATQCTASGGWSGSRATSGNITLPPSGVYSFGLTCTGAGGSATANGSYSDPVNGPIVP